LSSALAEAAECGFSESDDRFLETLGVAQDDFHAETVLKLEELLRVFEKCLIVDIEERRIKKRIGGKCDLKKLCVTIKCTFILIGR
jgi:hypothetical protein